MSCGQIALADLGITPDIYYASEIDKHAIGQTMLNFPNTVQLGSVVDVYPELLHNIDLLIGGSPCQSFSFAGKRKGMSTKDNEEIYTLERYLELKEQGFEFEGQSYLFWEYMRILTTIREYNPNVFFLLENVEMGKKWEKVLTEAIGVPGIHINSALVSAQNRKRIYWTNIPNVGQPNDRGLLLRDILETEVAEKYYLSSEIIAGFEKHAIRHSEKHTGFGWKPEDGSTKRRCLRASGSLCPTDNILKLDRKGSVKPNQDKSSCFTAGAHSGGNHSDMDLIHSCASMVGRKTDENGVRKDYDEALKTEQRIEMRGDGKTNCPTTVQKDNLVVQLNPSEESGGIQPYQQNRYYSVEGQSPCLGVDARSPGIVIPCDYRHDEGLRLKSDGKTGTLLGRARNDESCGQLVILQIPEATKKGFIEVAPGNCFDAEHPSSSSTRRGRAMEEKSNCLMAKGTTDFMQYQSPERIRRLTPTECARLQTIPEWYKWACSDTQQYRMLGNGWTVEVIKHIFRSLPIFDGLD